MCVCLVCVCVCACVQVFTSLTYGAKGSRDAPRQQHKHAHSHTHITHTHTQSNHARVLGIMYFCYWSPGGSLNGGIMAPKGNETFHFPIFSLPNLNPSSSIPLTFLGNASNYEATAHYAQAARINSHVLAYEQHLLRATSVGHSPALSLLAS